MSRIVLTAFGSYGDINPFLVLGRGLKDRGHQVVLATSEYYRSAVLRAGLEFFPVRPDADLDDRNAYHKIMDAARGSEYVVRDMVMPRVRETYEDLEKAARGADILVTHVLSFAAPLLAEKTGIKWVSTILSPMVFFSAYDPPFLAPAPWLRVLYPLGPSFNKVLFRSLRIISRSWSGPVRRLRKDLGLPPGEDPLFEAQHSPFAVLALFSRSLAQPQPDWPRRTRLCGFLFRDRDNNNEDADPGLAEFLEGKPAPVVFTMGSSAVKIAEPLFGAAIRSFQKIGCRAVILADAHARTLAAQNLPPDIRVLPSAPYHWLFPRCSVIVHQGGIGTTAQAMRSGKPMVVVPFAHDQYDNAAKMESLGIGKMVLRTRFSEKTFTKALRDVLSDPEAAKKAASIGQSVGAEDGLKEACDAIEAVIGNHAHSGKS